MKNLCKYLALSTLGFSSLFAEETFDRKEIVESLKSSQAVLKNSKLNIISYEIKNLDILKDNGYIISLIRRQTTNKNDNDVNVIIAIFDANHKNQPIIQNSIVLAEKELKHWFVKIQKDNKNGKFNFSVNEEISIEQFIKLTSNS